MFAVPGWSVAADTLQKEKLVSDNGGPAGAKSRKRKRAGAKEEVVTADNVADLYDSVLGGKEEKKQKKKKKKDAAAAEDSNKDAKRPWESEGKTQDAVASEEGNDEQGDGSVPAAVSGDKKGKKEKKAKQKGGDSKIEKKQDKKGKKEKTLGELEEPTKSEANAASKSSKTNDNVAVASPQASATFPQTQSTLTPLQAAMREKLVSARFRHLNETLYTRPSEEAFGLFQESPEMFDEYHQGFRRQVKIWPENPVDSFLQDIRTRAKIRSPPGKGKPNQPPTQISKSALPRTAGTCILADLGCGDARLAESLQADKDKSRLDIKSFDLQDPGPLITKADIANLPLEDGSVNVAIFCLALMGTNWLDFIEEAYRILHWKGELWIAEIKSRFGPVRSKNAPVSHSVGNRRKQQPTKKETAAREADARGRFEQDLAVEVDGLDDTRRETDVSAFIEALRKRGFVLQGERNEAVDLSNRMFVKMHFIKGAQPTVGKGVKTQEAAPLPPKKRKMFQFDQNNEKDEQVNEAAILKPCVYKIR